MSKAHSRSNSSKKAHPKGVKPRKWTIIEHFYLFFKTFRALKSQQGVIKNPKTPRAFGDPKAHKSRNASSQKKIQKKKQEVQKSTPLGGR